VFASHATVSRSAARQAASIIEGQGARYLDAPFTGSKMAAQNRQLIYYVGGSTEALEEIRPVLEASAKTILHVGGIGDASVLKIATNMITASTVQTLAEALALVRAAGVSGVKFAEALENNGSRSGTSDMKLGAMLAQNFEPNFSLKHMLKDARLALDLADGLQLSLPVTETTAEVLSLGMKNGWADQDFSAVAQLYPAPAVPERPASVSPATSAVEAKPSSESGTTAPAAVGTAVPTMPAARETSSPTDKPGKEALDGASRPPAAGKVPALVRSRALLQEGTQRALRVKAGAARALQGLWEARAPRPKRKPARAAAPAAPEEPATILPTEGLPARTPAADAHPTTPDATPPVPPVAPPTDVSPGPSSKEGADPAATNAPEQVLSSNG
jgi:3-hydroxyisobutyrate dehydrogenase